MKLKQFFTDKRAVSSVIGSIMLVAVMLLVVSSLVTVFLADSQTQFQDDIAHANFAFDWKGTHEGYLVTVKHVGGETYTTNNTGRDDPCDAKSLQIRSEEARLDSDPRFPEGTIDCWDVGASGGIEGGDSFEIGNEDNLSAHSDSAHWPESGAYRSVNPGDEIQVVWTGRSGGSTVIAEFVITRDSPPSPGSVSWDHSDDWDAAVDEEGVVHETFPGTDRWSSRVMLGHSTDRPGLVAYWPFDGDRGSSVADVAGPHDGDLVSGTMGVGGALESTAYDFPGNNYTEIPDAEELSPHVTQGEMTIVTWAKIHSYPPLFGQTRAPLVAKGRSTDGDWEYAQYVGSDGSFGLSIWQCDSGSGYWEKRGSLVPTGTWVQLVTTFDKENRMRTYIDGTLADEWTSGWSGSICAEESPVFHANRNYDGQPLNATLGEMMLFDRELSATEVQDLYNASQSGYIVTDWKSLNHAIPPDSLELEDLDYDLNGQSITVYVESDAGETSDPISLGGGTRYDVTGLSTPTDSYRLRIELDSSSVTDSPVFHSGTVSP